MLEAVFGGARRNEDAWVYAVPDTWRQGRTLYGGMAAALCFEAATRTIPDLPPLRSAQVAFAGPATGEVAVRAQLLRRGKSSAFVGCALSGADGPATTATFCFAADRSSAYTHEPRSMPEVQGAQDCPSLFGGFPGPDFAQHFEMRLAGGSRPMSGGAPELLAWVRFRQTEQPRGVAALIALGDALPPAAMGLFTAPAMISSMTWSFEVLDPGAAEAGADWWLMEAAAEHVAHGYSSQRMRIWTQEGLLVVTGRQLIAQFG